MVQEPQLQLTLFPIHGTTAFLQAGASPGLMSTADGVAEKRGGLYPPHLHSQVLISQTKSLEKLQNETENFEFPFSCMNFSLGHVEKG